MQGSMKYQKMKRSNSDCLLLRLSATSRYVRRKIYVKSAILYGSELWSPKENEIGILKRTEICMVRAMCGIQLKDKKS